MQTLRSRFGTGNHPLNGAKPNLKRDNAQQLRNATSTQEAYTPEMIIRGKRQRVQLPPVRHGEVAGGHGNRMTMTNTMDTVGHGGYRRRVAAEAQRRYGRDATSKGQFIEQAMKRHHEAAIEARKRKYDKLR